MRQVQFNFSYISLAFFMTGQLIRVNYYTVTVIVRVK